MIHFHKILSFSLSTGFCSLPFLSMRPFSFAEQKGYFLLFGRVEAGVRRMASPVATTGRQLLSSFENFLFDADGVLWVGGHVLPGAISFLNELINRGKKVFIITNNSTKTLEDYAAKCKKLGFTMVPEGQILSPARVLACTLAKEKSTLPVYLIGSEGLRKELLKEGVQCIGGGPDPVEKYTNSDFIFDIDVSKPVRAVVVSYDVHVNYAKVMKAVNYLYQPGVQFFATNEDITFPGPNKEVRIPGSGMNVMAVKATAEMEPVVIGKPSRPIFDYIKEKFSIDPSRTIMIGDRCDTDIKFGRDNGICSLLVETGIHNIDNVKQYLLQSRSDLVPDFYCKTLEQLLASI